MSFFDEANLTAALQNLLYERGSEKLTALLKQELELYSDRISPEVAHQAAEQFYESVKTGDFDNILKRDLPDNELEALQSAILSVISENDLIDLEFGRILSQNFASDYSTHLYKSLRQNWKSYQATSIDVEIDFKSRLREVWDKALTPTEMLLNAGFEIGDEFIDYTTNQKTKDASPRHIAMSLLHRRSCRTGSEILCLLENGFADGAMSRWRTLHELFVVLSVIQGSDDSVAQRYLEHKAVDRYIDLIRREENIEKLGYARTPLEIRTDIEHRYKTALEKYGFGFKKTFGWAEPITGNSGSTFRDLEEISGKSHLRYHYRIANAGIHASSSALYAHLGSFIAPTAGASNMGLEEPGQNTAISLFESSATLLSESLNLDRAVFISTLAKIRDEAVTNFSKVGREVFDTAIELHSKH